jgi:glycosyltransferase involved in cell wall biosynthesis/putative flippase GtrA
MLEIILKLIGKHKEAMKYLIAGGFATLVDFVVLYILTDIVHIWYLLSSVIAFIAAFGVSFSLQKFWTFRDGNTKVIREQMFYYFIVALINLGINTLFIYILVDHIRLWYMLGQFIASAFIAIWSYLIYKFMIFNQIEPALNPDRRKRILLATGIYPPDIGGPATMLGALADGLIRNGFEVEIITYADKSGNEKGITRIDRYRPALIRHVSYFRRMYKLARGCDLIYATDTYSVGFFSYILKFLLDKRYIIRFAGDSAWESAVSGDRFEQALDGFYEQKLDKRTEASKNKEKKILTNADKVIAVSEFMKSIAIKIGVRKEMIRVIYNSVDFAKEEPDRKNVDDLRTKYKSDGAMIVMCIGRLTKWKGVDGLIGVMPELSGTLNVKLLVLGDGPEMPNLKILAKKKKVEDNVIFLGRIGKDRVIDHLRIADVFVLNSNYEGLSHTLLEAMKAGVPVVASSVGGNSEVIEDGVDGMLVGYNSYDRLLATISSILKDQDLAKHLAANAGKKLEKFNWDTNLKETSALINSLL